MLSNTPLRDVVQELMQNHREDAKQVRARVLVKASGNPSLAAELLGLGADQAIRNYFQNGRRVSLAEVEVTNAESASHEGRASLRRVNKAKAERTAQRLLKLFWDRYSLFGHMLLGDATVKDLRASATKRIAMAKGNQRAADFELALMKGMKTAKPSAKVRDFYAPAKVAELAAKHNVK